MAEPILIHPFFVDYILPFVLVFTLIFAILEKTKLLGDDKKQINAMIGLVVGLILVAFSHATHIVVQMTVFLAVSSVILLVFMLLYGFITGEKEGDPLRNKWLKAAFGIILGIGVIIYFMIAIGWWGPVQDYLFNTEGGTNVWVNVLLIAVIAGAIIAVLTGGGGGKSST